MGIWNWTYLLICISIAEAFGIPDAVHHYEVVPFEILEHRSKRAASSEIGTDLEVKFAAFGTEFHLLLNNDPSFPGGNWSNAKFYEGVLKDKRSSVLCFLLYGSLTAVVTTEDGILYTEPPQRFLGGIGPQEIVAYRSADLDWTVLSRNAASLHRNPSTAFSRSGLDMNTLADDSCCEIEIVADHTTYEHLGRDDARVSATLYLHGKFADAVFRNTNFGLKAWRLRITVAKISLYRSPGDRNYPMVNATSINKYLSLFVLRKQESRFCLSLGLLYRQFRGTAIGEAFRPDVRRGPALGGICERPVHLLGGRTLSFNTGVLNLQYQTGKPIPLAVTLQAFAHEVAHGFGAGHDPSREDPACSPRDNPFLMYPVSLEGSENWAKMSPCSRTRIRETVRQKGVCLLRGHAECGNGVQEGEEECDCGTHATCDEVDPCCIPSDEKPPAKGCTLRYKCSPKEHLCCNSDCRTVRAKGTICYRDDTLCSLALCDGRKPECPEPGMPPTGVCERQTLSTCACENNNTEDCCLHDGFCVPTAEVGRNRSDGQLWLSEPGYSCRFGTYRCDDNGNCFYERQRSEARLLVVVIMTAIQLVLSLGMVYALFFICRREFWPLRTSN